MILLTFSNIGLINQRKSLVAGRLLLLLIIPGLAQRILSNGVLLSTTNPELLHPDKVGFVLLLEHVGQWLVNLSLHLTGLLNYTYWDPDASHGTCLSGVGDLADVTCILQ